MGSDEEFRILTDARLLRLERAVEAQEDRAEKADRKLDEQTRKLDEILTLMQASKLGLKALNWLIALGFAIGTLYAAFKGAR